MTKNDPLPDWVEAAIEKAYYDNFESGGVVSFEARWGLDTGARIVLEALAKGRNEKNKPVDYYAGDTKPENL